MKPAHAGHGWVLVPACPDPEMVVVCGGEGAGGLFEGLGTGMALKSIFDRRVFELKPTQVFSV